MVDRSGLVVIGAASIKFPWFFAAVDTLLQQEFWPPL